MIAVVEFASSRCWRAVDCFIRACSNIWLATPIRTSINVSSPFIRIKTFFKLTRGAIHIMTKKKILCHRSEMRNVYGFQTAGTYFRQSCWDYVHQARSWCVVSRHLIGLVYGYVPLSRLWSKILLFIWRISHFRWSTYHWIWCIFLPPV